MTRNQIRIADMACFLSDLIEAGQPIIRDEIARHFPGASIADMASALLIAVELGEDEEVVKLH